MGNRNSIRYHAGDALDFLGGSDEYSLSLVPIFNLIQMICSLGYQMCIHPFKAVCCLFLVYYLAILENNRNRYAQVLFQ